MIRLRYFAFRLVQMVFVIFLVLTFLFILFRSIPGDFTDLMVYQGASPETIIAIEERWGFNDPLHVQYWKYVNNLLSFNPGTSLVHQVSVWEYTRPRLFNTLILAIPGVTAGYLIGGIGGTLLATTDRSALQRYGTAFAVFVGTIPIFFLGIIGIITFASFLNWTPSAGMVTNETLNRFSDAPWWRVYLTVDFATHYLLPFSIIALRYSSLPTLLMRTNVEEVLGEGFVFYQRITGLPPRWRKKHLARHGSLPVITYYPVTLAQSISGLVLLEVVFNWPGIGYTLVQALFARDFPVIQFIFFLIAISVIFGNLLIDLLYGVIDPRVSIDD